MVPRAPLITVAVASHDRPLRLRWLLNALEEQTLTDFEVVEAVCRAAGSDVEPDVRGEGTPHAEIDRQWVDSSKLRDLTHWRPEVGLDEGLRRTVEWYRAHPEALQG